jgi:hypothetical protein
MAQRGLASGSYSPCRLPSRGSPGASLRGHRGEAAHGLELLQLLVTPGFPSGLLVALPLRRSLPLRAGGISGTAFVPDKGPQRHRRGDWPPVLLGRSFNGSQLAPGAGGIQRHPGDQLHQAPRGLLHLSRKEGHGVDPVSAGESAVLLVSTSHGHGHRVIPDARIAPHRKLHLAVGEVTRTMSPSRSPNRSAARGFTSTHECHVILLTGSGSSWSHGRLACFPSPNREDGYTIKAKSPSPSRLGTSKLNAVSGDRRGKDSSCWVLGSSTTPLRRASRQKASKSSPGAARDLIPCH